MYTKKTILNKTLPAGANVPFNHFTPAGSYLSPLFMSKPTINSLSGGKSSSYLAVKFPAEYNVFSVVCIDEIKCKPKDKFIINYASEKLQIDFIATA